MLVLTEEGYTSQSSFVHNDALPEFKKEVKNNTIKMDIDNNQSQTDSVKKSSKNKKTYNFSGKRYTNSFIFNKIVGVLKVVHADINASFNMIRKIFKNFKYSINIDISYKIKAVGINSRKKMVFSYI